MTYRRPRLEAGVDMTRARSSPCRRPRRRGDTQAALLVLAAWMRAASPVVTVISRRNGIVVDAMSSVRCCAGDAFRLGGREAVLAVMMSSSSAPTFWLRSVVNGRAIW